MSDIGVMADDDVDVDVESTLKEVSPTVMNCKHLPAVIHIPNKGKLCQIRPSSLLYGTYAVI